MFSAGFAYVVGGGLPVDLFMMFLVCVFSECWWVFVCLFSDLYLWGLNVDFVCVAGRHDGFSYLVVRFAWG